MPLALPFYYGHFLSSASYLLPIANCLLPSEFSNNLQFMPQVFMPKVSTIYHLCPRYIQFLPLASCLFNQFTIHAQGIYNLQFLPLASCLFNQYTIYNIQYTILLSGYLKPDKREIHTLRAFNPRQKKS